MVLFVAGVTPTKWARIWNERMPRAPLELRPAMQAEAVQSLRSGGSRLAFLRDVDAGDEFHSIPLYREAPVVVAPKDSAISVFDELTLDDLSGEMMLEGSDEATVELIAAGAGIAIMPHSIARVHSRRDVVARPVTDAPDWGISLVWRRDLDDPRVQTFIGIVRGRTENSTR